MAGRAPGAPCPQRSAGPATGAAHTRRERRIVRARLVCGDGESHTGFLLKFKTRRTQRAKLRKGKLKKEKVQRWGTFVHHLRLKKGFSRFSRSADGHGNCKKETIKRASARPRTITPYCPRTPGTSAVLQTPLRYRRSYLPLPSCRGSPAATLPPAAGTARRARPELPEVRAKCFSKFGIAYRRRPRPGFA